VEKGKAIYAYIRASSVCFLHFIIYRSRFRKEKREYEFVDIQTRFIDLLDLFDVK